MDHNLVVIVLFVALLVVLSMCVNIFTASIVWIQLKRVTRYLDIAERHGKLTDENKDKVREAANVVISTAQKTQEVVATVKEELAKHTSESGTTQ